MAYTEKAKDEIFKQILELVKSGEPIRNILNMKHMPDGNTFYRWISRDEDKNIKYENCKKYISSKKLKHHPNIEGSKAKFLNDYRINNARKVNSKKYPNSNLYIIKICESNLYKIGVSQNTKRRFKDLSNSMPFNIDVMLNLSVKNAYTLESKVHDVFKHKHIKNEWFSLNLNDYNKAVKLCQDQ